MFTFLSVYSVGEWLSVSGCMLVQVCVWVLTCVDQCMKRRV